MQCVGVSYIINMLLHKTIIPLQIWDETFQRVTNEQEIYEGECFDT